MSKNLEPPTFRKRGQKHTSAALGAPLEEEASVSNVAVSQSDTIEQEETEQEEGEPGEETQEASISEMLESQLKSPHEQLPKRRKMSRTLRSTRASVTREDEAQATEEEEPETPTPSKKVSGKNLAALKRQTAADTGKSVTELATPGETKTFKESVYGQDRGSTRIWGGKGRGKTGRKRRKPATPAKKKSGDELEGWQDSNVVPALKNKPPSGSQKQCAEDACRAKYGKSKMINTSRRGGKTIVTPKLKNPALQSNVKAATKATEVCKKINKHGPYRPSAWLKDVRKLQKSVELLIKKLPFQRLVCEIAQGINVDLRFQGKAILALQEATEAFLVKTFTFANLCAIHGKWRTLMPKDIHLLQKIWEDTGFFIDRHNVNHE